MRLLIIFFICVVYSQNQNLEDFGENLYIKPLTDGKYLFHFEFSSNYNDTNYLLFKLNSKETIHIVNKFDVKELHLSLTKGRWNYEKWGNPISPSPTGAELISWFHSPKNTSIKWKGLVHSLSGLLCGSFNFFDLSTSKSYQAGIVSKKKGFRYGTLSNEPVCTENLTPFKNLLPSKGICGFSNLLNPLKLYDSHFHSMSLHIKKNSDNIKIVQSLSVVFDLSKEDQVFGDWYLTNIFGTKKIKRCPFSKETNIILIKGDEMKGFSNKYQVIPEMKSVNQFIDKLEVKDQEIDLNFRWKQQTKIPSDYSNLSLISSSRYEKSLGLEGIIFTKIKNNSNKTLTISFFDAIPWYLRVHFHTLKAKLNQRDINDFKFQMKSAKERIEPYEYEFIFSLPPNSILEWSFSFEKAYLPIADHSPDPNRGFDLSSSIITFHLDKNEEMNVFQWDQISLDLGNVPFCRYYTDSLLIMLPTPDFSMPYNVICLSSTLIAVFLSSMINALMVEEKKEKKD